MKKTLSFIILVFLSFNMFCQMISVSGQPSESHQRSAKANDSIAFDFYYPRDEETQVYVTENGFSEEIVWADTPFNFTPLYRGQLGSKYYFYSNYEGDDLLYEYNHATKETKKISFPPDYPCTVTLLLTDKLNEKIYFGCGVSSSGDRGVLGFDGNNFEAFDSPPGYMIFQKDYLFAPSLNQILIWYFDWSNPQDGALLYTFNDNSLTHIPNPAGNAISGKYGIPFENNILLPYVDILSDGDIYTLYKYDGVNLTQIPGLPNTLFHNMRISVRNNEAYIALDDYLNYTSSLYKYDGNTINEVFTSTFYNPNFITEFDGKDIFSLANVDLSSTDLYTYDGVTFKKINGPENTYPIDFSGILNNKLYLRYIDDSTQEIALYSYNPGELEVQLVSNVPQGISYRVYNQKYNNHLLHKFEANYINDLLFAQDQSNNFFSLNPENHTLDLFEYQLEDKLYFSFYDSDWVSQLYMWDGVLSTPDYDTDQNDIVIYPNPVSDFVFVKIPNKIRLEMVEISLFSTDGKIVRKQYLRNKNSQIQLSLENLTSGIYFLELKGETTIIRKKIIKK